MNHPRKEEFEIGQQKKNVLNGKKVIETIEEVVELPDGYLMIRETIREEK